MTRVKFWDLFQSNPDGSIEPKKQITLAGVVLSPGVRFNRGVLFSGVDLFQYYGRDLEVDDPPGNNPTVITGVY